MFKQGMPKEHKHMMHINLPTGGLCWQGLNDLSRLAAQAQLTQTNEVATKPHSRPTSEWRFSIGVTNIHDRGIDIHNTFQLLHCMFVPMSPVINSSNEWDPWQNIPATHLPSSHKTESQSSPIRAVTHRRCLHHLGWFERQWLQKKKRKKNPDMLC